MNHFTACLAILGIGAILCALFAGRPRAAAWIFRISLTFGCVLGLLQAFAGFAGGPVEVLRSSWQVPLGEFALAADPLSAFFLLLTFGICLPAGWFGEGYLAASRRLSANGSIRPLFLLMVAAISSVVCARNAVLFIAAWEIMALCSFMLIMAEHEEPVVRRASRSR